MPKIPPWLWMAGGALLILALTTGGVVTANYLTATWMASENARKWAPILQSVEDTFGLPPGLLARIAYQESRFRQDVIDGSRASTAGALGMMQLEPAYFSTVNRPRPYSNEDTQDQVVEAANELVRLFHHYQDWTRAVAAYNAGEGKIDHVLAGTATLPSQTADYLSQVSADLPHIVNPTLSA